MFEMSVSTFDVADAWIDHLCLQVGLNATSARDDSLCFKAFALMSSFDDVHQDTLNSHAPLLPRPESMVILCATDSFLELNKSSSMFFLDQEALLVRLSLCR